MDPVKSLTTPVAEVRAQAPVQVDEYGESWVVIDGVETKVPNLKAARELLDQQDATRKKIRADLDATGVRDRTEQVEITLDDGTKTTVELLPMGDSGANIMQIGGFPGENGPIPEVHDDEPGVLDVSLLEKWFNKIKHLFGRHAQ